MRPLASLALALCAALTAAGGTPQPLVCGSAGQPGTHPPPGTKATCTLSVLDKAAAPGTVQRQMELYVPNTTVVGPLPLLLWFHGQAAPPPAGAARGRGQQQRGLARNVSGGAAGAGPLTAPFEQLADALGFILVYPLGLDDIVPGDITRNCGTGWNVMGGHEASSCLNYTAVECCYSSCRKLGVCSGDGAASNCGWTTCHDDLLFVETILDTLLGSSLSINSDKIYNSGASNGAMLGYTLSSDSRFASTFDAFLPAYGGILVDQLLSTIPSHARLLTMHGRSDTEIPPNGGTADDGWLYVPEEDIVTSWAASRGCPVQSDKPTAFETPFDAAIGRNLACLRYDSCEVPTAVRCMYDGIHGEWPGGAAYNELIVWWFLNQTATLPPPPPPASLLPR